MQSADVDVPSRVHSIFYLIIAQKISTLPLFLPKLHFSLHHSLPLDVRTDQFLSFPIKLHYYYDYD